MNALLILAHGSPRPEANRDVLRVAELLAARKAWPIIVVGYLDCNQPDIPSAIDLCVENGATRIAAVPYFLHSGRHFLLDLPRLLEEGKDRHPGVEIVMGDYIGHMPQLGEVIADRVAAVRGR